MNVPKGEEGGGGGTSWSEGHFCVFFFTAVNGVGRSNQTNSVSDAAPKSYKNKQTIFTAEAVSTGAVHHPGVAARDDGVPDVRVRKLHQDRRCLLRHDVGTGLHLARALGKHAPATATTVAAKVVVREGGRGVV